MANKSVYIEHGTLLKKRNILLKQSVIFIEHIQRFLFLKSPFSIERMLNVISEFSPRTKSSLIVVLLAREFEQALMNAGIKYRIYGGTKFYQRSEIKSALAYLRLIENNNDNDAFRRIINFPPRAIGKATLEKIELGAKKNRCSLFAFIQIDPQLSKQKKINEFIELIHQCKQRSVNDDDETKIELHEQALNVFERSGLMHSYEKKQEVERLQNLSELCNAMKQFAQLYQTNDLTQYLSVIALVKQPNEC